MVIVSKEFMMWCHKCILSTRCCAATTTFTREPHQRKKMHHSILMQQTAPVLFVPGFSFTNSHHFVHTHTHREKKMQESCREMRRTSGSSSLSSLRSLYCGESHYSFFLLDIVWLFWLFDMKRGLLLLHQKQSRSSFSFFCSFHL